MKRVAKLKKFDKPKVANGKVTLAIQYAKALLAIASKDTTRENLRHIIVATGPDGRPWLAATDGNCALYVQCEAAEASTLSSPVLMVADVLGAIASAKANKQDYITVEIKKNDATTPTIWQVYPNTGMGKSSKNVGIDPASLASICESVSLCSNGDGVTMDFGSENDAITIESVCGQARALTMPMRIK